MRDTFRDLWRRKLRCALTVLGIAIGAFSLTVLGALSEKLNRLVGGALEYYNTRIIVQSKTDARGPLAGIPVSAALVEKIERLDGVDRAYPTVYLPYKKVADEYAQAPTFSLPPLVKGIAPRYIAEQKFPVKLERGRFYDSGERGVVVVGSAIARADGVEIGQELLIYGRRFRVIGIMEHSLTVRDNIAMMPLSDAQELLAGTIPPPFGQDPYALATEIEVFPVKLDQAAAVARSIDELVPGVRVFPPGEFEQYYEEQLAIFEVITVGSAIIALLVGGLAILNTMIMSVSERTQEIGIKKAIGASRQDIGLEFLLEAVVIAFLGCVFGLVLGVLAVWFLNQHVMSGSIAVFLFTPRLGVFVLIFTGLIGVLAGLYPALSAARLEPAEALRSA